MRSHSSFIFELHVLLNETTKEKLYRLRIEKFSITPDKTNSKDSDDDKKPSTLTIQSILEKHVFTGADASCFNKARYFYDEASENVLSVFRQLLAPYLSDTLNYACSQSLAPKLLLKYGSIELKKILFKQSMLGQHYSDASGSVESNLGEFLNYIWREAMGDLEDLFGKQFQMSNFSLEQV